MAVKRCMFLRNGEVVEISQCEEDYADIWCKIRIYDSWMEVKAEHGSEVEDVRMLEPGDKLEFTGKKSGTLQVDKKSIKSVSKMEYTEQPDGNRIPKGTYKAAKDIASAVAGKY